ncbi:alpha-amylase family glycosyl hydrolase [Hymenobacter guriensis]|uniref:Glycosyl hydrolase family 13 catalytic domain-containing protein n=1 Tax=Hymenobacter guriensis TaxID=2793065 RepID=A0ABS0L682_9BACT|nr:alpha-amylase family glycosyl hydrolase [Hymenobacter guriensis]MBG8555646.1 hypothetical protein [Hymenobacter guriensis]
MSFFNTALKYSFTCLTAASLLASCKPDKPDAPAPIDPPVTEKPTQYGTPFAGVPSTHYAVIYQVNMRAFSQAGNFAGVTARLDSIKALGANVVYLMPIHPVGQVRGVNSPYAVRDYTAVNSEFGTLDDLRSLVDAAHARGLAVMLDWVANHTSWDNAWVREHPDWYLQNAAGTILSPPNTNYTDVAQLNFNSQPMRLAMISAMKSWVYSANVDGFRCDYADAVPVDFWKQAVDTLRNIKSHKLLLLSEGTESRNLAAGFNMKFGFNFYGGLWDVYRRGQPATTFDALNASEYVGVSDAFTPTGIQRVVRYTTNHDVNGSDGTPVALFGGDAGAMSAFVIASCYKGVPMIYNGQESGMSTAITFPFTSVNITWDTRPDVTKAYKQLLRARAKNSNFALGNTTSYSTADVCAFTKQGTPNEPTVLVMVNVRNKEVKYTLPPALANTTWTNALQGGEVALGTEVTLPAYGYMVLD